MDTSIEITGKPVKKVVVVRNGLVLASVGAGDKLRLPLEEETSDGLVIISSAPNGVVLSSTGLPDGCAFVTARRLQDDLSDAESDELAELLLGSAGGKLR